MSLTPMGVPDVARCSGVKNNSRTITPEHDVKPASTRYQKAEPAIKKREPSEICKTSIAGSNPGGASNPKLN
jgi:hypothetical protein